MAKKTVKKPVVKKIKEVKDIPDGLKELADKETREIQKKIMAILQDYGEKWDSDHVKYPADLVPTMYLMIILDVMVGAGGLAALMYEDPMKFYSSTMPALVERSIPMYEDTYKMYLASVMEKYRLARKPDEAVH